MLKKNQDQYRIISKLIQNRLQITLIKIQGHLG